MGIALAKPGKSFIPTAFSLHNEPGKNRNRGMKNKELADSWFMCETFVSEIQKIKIRYAKKLHVIGLMKTNRYIVINGITKTASLVPVYK
jgi:hypothetical protein